MRLLKRGPCSSGCASSSHIGSREGLAASRCSSRNSRWLVVEVVQQQHQQPLWQQGTRQQVQAAAVAAVA
jgi:hypothetical protein